ncbi:restriction endonuclease subunit S [Salinicola halophyticus]|uniref:restriction endonuclease subunit S n=1 Tax=Salinicola halophyticus TaxID=1808881 RepID=UPI003F48A80F
MSAEQLITDHLDLWTSAITHKRSAGRSSGKSGKIELTGIKKLRELILELAVRGKLVEQDSNDEPASVLLEKIAEEKARLVKEGRIKKPKKLPEVTEGEYSSNVPLNWKLCRLNDIGAWGAGATPRRGNQDYYNGSIPWFKSGELSSDFIESSEETISSLALKENSLRLNKPGDVLIAMYGATIGKASITTVESTSNQAVCACTPWRGVSNLYLLTLLKAYRSRFTAMGAGGAQPNISREKIIATPIALPPLQEQYRIVAKVDELMTLCDRLEQQAGDQLEAHEVLVDTLLDALTRAENADEVATQWARLAEHFDTLFTTEGSIDKLKQAILQLAVIGRLVEQDPNDEPASVLLEKIAEEKARLIKEGKARKQKPLPEIAYDEYPFEIPAGWIISRMDDVTDIKSGIAKGKKLSGKPSTWLPYLRVANVQRGTLDLSEVKEIEIACDEIEKHLVKERDLLITEGGDWDKVGRTAIWNAEIDPMAHQNHVFRARLILDEQNENWIEKYLNSGFARDYFANSSKQTTNLASINKTQLRSCTVPIPPLEEQHRIVAKVDELMALCDQLKARLSNAGETRTRLAEAVVKKGIH